jgi:uncharacterized protein involved in type VI secretion and phage assembly
VVNATATPGHSSSPREAGRHYGKYRGVVTNNKDPRNHGRLRLKVPEILGDVESGWALPCTPYAGEKTGYYAVPPVNAGIWVEFEAGEVSRPIWVGCWWASDKAPRDEAGASATPDVKLTRSEEGLLLALHDDTQTIALSDANGANILKIEVQQGFLTIKATTKVVVDAPLIELVANATHPGVFGDNLMTYLSQLVSTFNMHMHVGQMAAAVPVTPAPPVAPQTPPTPSLISTKVTLG